MLLKGYTHKEISDNIPYTDKRYITRIVEKLKKERRITEKQIEQGKFERTEKRRLEIVLRGLKLGLTFKETAEIDKSIGLYEEQYRNCRTRLVQERKNNRTRNKRAKRISRQNKSKRKRRRI